MWIETAVFKEEDGLRVVKSEHVEPFESVQELTEFCQSLGVDEVMIRNRDGDINKVIFVY